MRVRKPQSCANNASDRPAAEVPTVRKSATEQTLRYFGGLTPMAYGRERAAKLLSEIMTAREESKDRTATNNVLATRCGIDRNVIRGWRSGERSIPLGALYVLPPSLVGQLLARLKTELVETPTTRDRSLDSHARRLGAQLGVFFGNLEIALAEGALSSAARRKLMLDLLEIERRCVEASGALLAREESEL